MKCNGFGLRRLALHRMVKGLPPLCPPARLVAVIWVCGRISASPQRRGLGENGSQSVDGPQSKTMDPRSRHQRPMAAITRAGYWLARFGKLRFPAANLHMDANLLKPGIEESFWVNLSDMSPLSPLGERGRGKPRPYGRCGGLSRVKCDGALPGLRPSPTRPVMRLTTGIPCAATHYRRLTVRHE